MQEISHRRRSRQRILQWLYANHVGGDFAVVTLEQIRRHFPNLDGEEPSARPSHEDWHYTDMLSEGLIAHVDDIDELIRSSSHRWRLERMDMVSLSILRLSVFELAFVPKIPSGVILSEAVALSQRYGDGRSVSFVNGLLEEVRRSLQRGDRRAPDAQ